MTTTTKQAIARRVNEAAKASIAAGEGFGGQAYISDVARRLGTTASSFERGLVTLQAEGLVTLGRADLVAAMDADKVRLSEVRRLNATFHLVRG